MKKKKVTKEEIRLIKEDYQFDDSIFNDQDEITREAFKIVSELPEPDKLLFVLYTEFGTYKKVGEILNVSSVTVGKEIKKIQQHIKEKIITNIKKQ